MDTGKSIGEFDISDVSEGCNYSDDILAITKKQSPNSMNVEFFNGVIRKRPGELSFTAPPGGQGGIDSFTKLLLHMDGVDATTTFTDSETTPKTVNNPETYDAATVLMLHMDGADSGTVFTDSATGKAITNIGSPVTQTGTKKLGTASLFTDSVSWLSTPDSADFDMGSGDFTMDFWFNPTLSQPGTSPEIIAKSADLSHNGYGYGFLYRNDSGGGPGYFIDFVAYDVLGTIKFGAATPARIVIGSGFHHVAVVRFGNTWTVYLDGVAGPTTVYSGVLENDVTQPLLIGHTVYGYIDEVRITKGVARWTSAFTPPAYPYGLATVSTPNLKLGTASGWFDGSGSHLSLADSTDWNFGAGDFTVDCWVKRITVGLSSSLYFCGQCDNTVAAGVSFVAGIAATDAVTVSISTDGTTLTTVTTTSKLDTIGAWYHVAFVRFGTTFSIYINGVLDVTSVIGSVTLFNSPNLFGIGSGGEYTSHTFFGYIDEFRVSKGVARWTTDFIPPSVPYDTFNASITPIGFSLFDFSDTNAHHKQIAHLGQGVYAYDQISNSQINLRYGAPLVRSYNSNIGGFFIQTYNDYSAPYYWDGITASMATLSNNAPGFKRTIEFQGYLLGMNIATNKTRIYYQLVGNIIGGGAAYSDFFTLTPSPNDDEISDPFILYGRLYVGTKYGIFRISFVGGVTIFEFKQAVSIVGIVPNTTQVVVTRDFGQVAIFLGTDKRLYLFDGANVKAISDLFFYHNNSTSIAMDLIDDNYLQNSFAIYDTTRRIYRLFVTKKASSTNYYCMNVEVESFAYYPFDNMKFSCGAMCYDQLLRPFVVGIDYAGILHKLFIENNTDNGTAINEYYESPIVSVKSTSIKQAQVLTVAMIPSSNANLIVYEKVDFKRAWIQRGTIPCYSSRDKFLGQSFVLGSAVLGSEKDIIYPKISANASFNYYQFKLVSDTPTLPPWEIIDVEFDESMLKYGRAEAQR